jgi:outer membrane protein OmpA-like peptidoglycan-associated protein
MTDNNRDLRAGAGIGPKRPKWLTWALVALGAIVLLLLISRCGGREDAGSENDAAVPPTAVAPADRAIGVPITRSAETTAALNAYLAGADDAPRTFAFERVTFDTGSSEIRPADQDEIMAVATVLKQHESARIRLYGYADQRGSDPANRELGQARANTVRSALIAAGVDARRIEALSGGESNPVGGETENRRTELVVVQR